MKRNSLNLLTNWANGMKIDSSHFENSEMSLSGMIQDSFSHTLTPYNFGLMDTAKSPFESIEVSVSKTVNDNYQIVVSRLRAVTYGGIFIDVRPEITGDLTCNFQSDNSRKGGNKSDYLLMVSADWSKRVPAGQADPSETPMRQPFVHPAYALDVISAENYSVDKIPLAALVIGKLVQKGDELVWDKNYIPPVSSVRSYPLLRQKYNVIAEQLNTLQIASYNIIYKVVNKNQNIPLAFNIKFICEKIIYHLSSLYFPQRYYIPHNSPLFLIDELCQVANNLKFAIDFLHEKEKEDILNYFKEWSELSPGRIDEILTAMIEVDYDHHNIADSVDIGLEFIQEISDLFKRISELDIIGKRRGDKIMAVRESSPKPQKKFKLLD
jgi:hypothetical protein